MLVCVDDQRHRTTDCAALWQGPEPESNKSHGPGMRGRRCVRSQGRSRAPVSGGGGGGGVSMSHHDAAAHHGDHMDAAETDAAALGAVPGEEPPVTVGSRRRGRSLGRGRGKQASAGAKHADPDQGTREQLLRAPGRPRGRPKRGGVAKGRACARHTELSDSPSVLRNPSPVPAVQDSPEDGVPVHLEGSNNHGLGHAEDSNEDSNSRGHGGGGQWLSGRVQGDEGRGGGSGGPGGSGPAVRNVEGALEAVPHHHQGTGTSPMQAG